MMLPRISEFQMLQSETTQNIHKSATETIEDTDPARPQIVERCLKYLDPDYAYNV